MITISCSVRLAWLGLAMLALTACRVPASAPAIQPVRPTAVIIQPTTTSEPSPRPLTPTSATASELPDTSSGALFFWPAYVPDSLVISAEHSWADEQGFQLTLFDPTDAQRTLELYGGVNTPAARRPPAVGSQSVAVRGLPGVSFSTGAGRSLHWDENGQPYSLGGFFSTDELLAVAQQLELVELAGWRQRITASLTTASSTPAAEPTQ